MSLSSTEASVARPSIRSNRPALPAASSVFDSVARAASASTSSTRQPSAAAISARLSAIVVRPSPAVADVTRTRMPPRPRAVEQRVAHAAHRADHQVGLALRVAFVGEPHAPAHRAGQHRPAAQRAASAPASRRAPAGRSDPRARGANERSRRNTRASVRRRCRARGRRTARPRAAAGAAASSCRAAASRFEITRALVLSIDCCSPVSRARVRNA